MKKIISRWKKPLVVLLVAVVYAVPILVLPGHAGIFLKMGKIDGESTVEGFEKWIEIEGVGFGVSRPVSIEAGGKTTIGKAVNSGINLVKGTDSSSPLLFIEAVAGVPQDDVMLKFTKTGGKGEQEVFFEIELDQVLVSGMDTSSGGERPSESIILDYGKIQMKYTPFDPGTGKLGSPIPAGFDFPNQKKL